MKKTLARKKKLEVREELKEYRIRLQQVVTESIRKEDVKRNGRYRTGTNVASIRRINPSSGNRRLR